MVHQHESEHQRQQRRTKLLSLFSGGMKATYVGAAVRFSLAAGIITFFSWFGFGFSAWGVVCGLLVYHVYRQHRLAIKDAVVQSHRSLMVKEGFDALFKVLGSHMPPSWVSYPEAERSHTLNALISTLWPSVKVAAENVIKASTQATFAELKSTLGLSTLKFEVLELTNDAPKILNVDTVTVDSAPAIDIKLTLGGPSNIVIAVGKSHLKVLVSLKDFRLETTLRVYLAHTGPGIPGFKALCISMVTKPIMKYKLKAGAISKIPGLEGIIHSIVDDTVATLLLWPKKIVVPMEEGIESELSYLESSAALGLLRITFKYAENLRNSEYLGKSDPYVKAFIRGTEDAKKTRVINNNLNPTWDESVQFEVYNPSHETLTVQVWDKDVDKDDLLGMTSIEVRKFFDNPNHKEHVERDLSYHSGKKTAGKVVMTVEYKPFLTGEGLYGAIPQLTERTPGWTVGTLYIDVKSLLNVVSAKKKNVSVTIAFEGKEYTTASVAPDNNECVYAQGFRFPLTAISQLDATLSITLNHLHDASTYQFDATKLFQSPNGQFTELTFDCGAVLQFHMTLRVVDPEGVSALAASRAATRRYGMRPQEAIRAAHESKQRTLEAANVNADTLFASSRTNGSRRTADDGSSSGLRRRRGGEPNDGAHDARDHDEPKATSAANTTAGDASIAAGIPTIPPNATKLDIAKTSVAIVRKFYRKLPQDAQSSVIAGICLFVIQLCGPFWRWSLVGFLMVAAAYFFAWYDLRKRYDSKSRPLRRIISHLEEHWEPDEEMLSQLYLNLPPFCNNPVWEKQEWINDLLCELWPKISAQIASDVKTQIKDIVNPPPVPSPDAAKGSGKTPTGGSGDDDDDDEAGEEAGEEGEEEDSRDPRRPTGAMPRRYSVDSVVTSNSNLEEALFSGPITITPKADSPFSFFDEVEFDIVFGEPPLITSMLSPTKETLSTQCVLDLHLEFGHDIYVALNLRKNDYQFPIEVRDFFLSASLRVVLRDFVNAFPCFANMDVCFNEAPKIDFNLNLFHLPVMSFPGLSQGLNAGIKYGLNWVPEMSLLWPRYYTIPILDPNDPALMLEATRDKPFGILRVTVVRGYKLRKVDRFSESDPYVTLIFHEQEATKYRTKHIDNNANPFWDETFEFVVNKRWGSLLSLKCKDYDSYGSHTELGSAEVHLDEFEFETEHIIERSFDFEHKGKPAGGIDVRFQFKQFVDEVPEDYRDFDNEKHSVAVVYAKLKRVTGIAEASSPRLVVTADGTTKETEEKDGDNMYYNETLSFLIRDVFASNIVVRVIDTKTTLRVKKSTKERASCSIALAELARNGTLSGPFSLDGGGTLEATFEMYAVSPDPDIPGILSWGEYTELVARQRFDAARAVEAATTANAPQGSGTTQAPTTSARGDGVVGTTSTPATPVGTTTASSMPEGLGVSTGGPAEDTAAAPPAIIPPTRGGHLLLRIICGENLPAVDRSGFSDPYVGVYVNGKKKTTHHISRTINPTWNESLDFRVEHPQNVVATFKVKDHNTFRGSKSLGVFHVNLSEVPTVDEVVRSYALQAPEDSKGKHVTPRGKVTIGMRFQESAPPREAHGSGRATPTVQLPQSPSSTSVTSPSNNTRPRRTQPTPPMHASSARAQTRSPLVTSQQARGSAYSSPTHSTPQSAISSQRGSLHPITATSSSVRAGGVEIDFDDTDDADVDDFSESLV